MARVASALLVASALSACGMQSDADSAAVSVGPDGYRLGGQTGSLVPRCGLAPLSASGQAVPVGDALAVLYASDCPEAVTDGRVVLTGPDDRVVGLSLERLGDSGAYLVRADQSLKAGAYELMLPGATSTLAVGAEASPLPGLLGALRALPEAEDCPEDLRFELTLDSGALAYAPLLRLMLRIDAGEEQLFIDFGALELDAGRSVLELPRCGASSCLASGPHALRLRADIAGEAFGSEPLALNFDVSCADSALTTAASRGSFDDASASTSEAGCALASRSQPSSGFCAALFVSVGLVLSALRRRRFRARL